MARLKKGDRVQWRAFGEERVGRVVRKLASPFKVKWLNAASAPRPQYLVRSEGSGRIAAVKRRALKPSP